MGLRAHGGSFLGRCLFYAILKDGPHSHRRLASPWGNKLYSCVVTAQSEDWQAVCGEGLQSRGKWSYKSEKLRLTGSQWRVREWDSGGPAL